MRYLMLCALLWTGCVGETDDELDETEVAEQGVYSPWITYNGVSVRVCQTATRIYWQYTGNDRFTTASSWGTGISVLSSSVAGVPSSTKYRTKHGAVSFFDVQFYGAGTSPPYTFYSFPSC